ncbi:MAG: hypothetical protein HOA15_09490 [Candidatus Marinimicrobia bacterium]|jgi:hypothetical protein|nr:hypothetical protein [Candidatus Neomarinimicrobiota bacterium]MBT3676424.1 hypothetical protein [Candidatus Neomarinimicrobiota bacterium]MBT3763770.1 hypothetical protein [Candidatus Neomarinimicrobiota bacterium]MBT4067109.1 hypothetical protein [Candidatus Neomarinimicrobiota bacterium]MBT4270047.1 hypothetical protein [Candidatus Neomarinimicrobiota bacterium]
MKKILLIACMGLCLSTGHAQMKKSFGGMMGTRGFGVIFSGNWQIKRDMTVGFETRYYDIKNDTELPVYDPYTGNSYNVGDKALFMIPIYGTMKWFPFEGKIANNFSPFVAVKLGPVLAVDGNEEYRSFKSRWRKASTLGTYGGQIVFGVQFLKMGGGAITPSIGYEFIPMGEEVDGRDNYNGMAINISFSYALNRR